MSHVTQEGGIDESTSQLDATHGCQPAHRDRLTSSLGVTVDDNSGGIDDLHLPGGLQAPEGVGEQPAVVVAMRVRQGLSHESGSTGALVDVRRVLGQSGVAPSLTARVDDDVRVPGCREGRPDRDPARTRVAEILDDKGQRPIRPGWGMQPTAHPRAVISRP